MFLNNRKFLLITFLTALITYFFVELTFFKEKIISLEKYPKELNPNIVILTGGTNRIKDGFEIINNFGKGSDVKIKILVSGTGKGFTKASLQEKLNTNFHYQLIKCCVDLDSISQDTYSNANETLKWAIKNDIKEFMLITSNYHMPRSILEFKNKMPNIKISTYSIKPKQHNINEWLKSFETFSLVFSEFCKYIISNIRIIILRK